MNKMNCFFYLSTCSTCNKIIKELNLEGIKIQDIKNESITLDQLEKMKTLSGNYESLFSRRAMKYKSLGLANKTLNENDYKQLILEEYTFLKRPVLLYNDQIVIGNSKKSVLEMQQLLNSK